MIPFAILLLAIGLAPFLRRSWWEKYYPVVSIGLGLFVFTSHCLFVDCHRMAGIFVEYFSFIVLIGSLFVASGGIFLHTERHATPWMNTLLLAAAAHRFATKEALRANDFTFAPIREVAILFAGIFATMVPALDWLALNAHRLGMRTPGEFFWSSGILSSFLDNAPTYLNFLSAAMGLHGLALGNLEQMKILLSQHAGLLQAVSAGAVFFGAPTYIGNGPNFMVKSIAEHAGVKCPSFFSYVFRYSLPVLIPIFVLIWLLFFR
jgi:Na+/H+ antiporter NhaD/arsenite permease-like protein